MKIKQSLKKEKQKTIDTQGKREERNNNDKKITEQKQSIGRMQCMVRKTLDTQTHLERYCAICVNTLL